MSRTSANSLLNSLKGKIWLATSALAFFICTFGVFCYLLVSLIVTDTFYMVFIPFLVLALGAMIFGWWLSNEVVSPIEKVTLLAKSLERGVSGSLPRTTGSTETDELLQTLHRGSRQLQDLVNLMDQVAAGNLNVALAPLQSSDRLSGSFQKLLGKVSESIDAKQKLEKLEAAVAQVSEEISAVRDGNLDANVSADHAGIEIIAVTFNYLLASCGDLTTQARTATVNAKNYGEEIEKIIREISRQTESLEIREAFSALKKLPQINARIVEDGNSSIISAGKSVEKAGKGKKAAAKNLAATGDLRGELQAAVKRAGQFDERLREIAKIAKMLEDLTQRLNLIALNASIYTAGSGGNGRAASVIGEEIENLAERAAAANRQTTTLKRTLTAEITQINQLLETTVGEIAELSQSAIETGDALDELERGAGQFLNLQNRIAALGGEQSAETEKALRIFSNVVAEIETAGQKLKKAEALAANFGGVFNPLETTTVKFNLPAVETVTPKSDFDSFTIPLDENILSAEIKPENELEIG